MNSIKTSIGWAEYSWNPIVGCKFNCSYCYAKRMNDRFRWVASWDKPKLFEYRLPEPYYKQKPVKIFVGSMCDMFGPWIKEDWITRVIDVVSNCPQHTFMFLTKNPERYLDFIFPKNAMLGITITDQKFYDRHAETIRKLYAQVKNPLFASIEPIQGAFKTDCFRLFDLVIIGAETGRNAPHPAPEWIRSIDHTNIYYKKSLKHYESTRT